MTDTLDTHEGLP